MSKLRLLFIKEAQASYISHLDLLRTFQRAFPRTELLSKILPQRIGGRHTLVLRQLIHDLVHDTLDAGRQVTVDFLAIDFLKPLGKVCHQQLQFVVLQCPRRHLLNKGRHLFLCFLL